MTEGSKRGLSRRRRRQFTGLTIVCLGLALSGCETFRFYKQAIGGESQILAHRKPIQKLLTDPQTSPDLKEKFNLVLQLRNFAEKDLRLPTDDQYMRYVDLHRPYVVWNVHAAPEFTLQPTTWWYPFVGSLKYRGYFSERDALRYAGKLEKKGLEVYVEGVEAYSTLGWFKDPLLNTFIADPAPELAELLFHELAHQRVFISGDTDFNEAFATTVGEEGVRRWLQAKGDSVTYQKYAAGLQRNEQFVQLVMNARQQLKSLYGDKSSADCPDPKCTRTAEQAARLRQQKELLIAQLRERYAKLKAEWGGLTSYDHWFAKSLNNAQLNTVAAYYDLVPGFRALLQQQGGDLEKFYQAVRGLGKFKKEERHRKLKPDPADLSPVSTRNYGCHRSWPSPC